MRHGVTEASATGAQSAWMLGDSVSHILRKSRDRVARIKAERAVEGVMPVEAGDREA